MMLMASHAVIRAEVNSIVAMRRDGFSHVIQAVNDLPKIKRPNGTKKRRRNMLGLSSGQLQLIPYEPNWSLLFLQEKERLLASLNNYILDIQHIGSTSIPGMPAKPILDIGVAVANFEEAVRCVPLIEQLGYVYKGENGIPRRHYFVKGDPRTHHLHMLEIESEEWKHHLLFRDYLYANPTSAQEYANLKQTLATQFSADREAYQNGKENFIKAVLQKANQELL